MPMLIFSCLALFFVMLAVCRRASAQAGLSEIPGSGEGGGQEHKGPMPKGNSAAAWIPLPADGRIQWLVCRFPEPLTPKAVRVVEMPEPGSVSRICLLKPDGEEVLAYDGQAQSYPLLSSGMAEFHLSETFKTDAVKIYVDPASIAGRNGIDAAAAVDQHGGVHWFETATSSNGYLYRRPHTIYRAAGLVEALAASGVPEHMPYAEALLTEILDAQETREGHASRGNFAWFIDVGGVTDRNSVDFALRHLVPMMLQHRDRLSEPLQERTLEAIRLGLEEIQRLDVAPTYTNITSMDCLAACLGGELLGDAAVTKRGREKLKRFAQTTFENGAVFEYNAPTYTRVTIDALARLARLTQDKESAIIARTLAARIALSYALHLHKGSNRLAGPHSRAYYPSIVAIALPEERMLDHWIRTGAVPGWVKRAAGALDAGGQIDEAAVAAWDIGMTTCMTPQFALGLGSREISRQTSVFTLHYSTPGHDHAGVVYTRYLIDDDWFGTPHQAPNREGLPGFSEHGKFYGVQDGRRAIGLYAPRTLAHPMSFAPCSRDKFTSAKAAFIWPHKDTVEEIWINDARVTRFPVDVPDGSVVSTAMGNVMLAVRPLARTDLGCGAPMRLNVVDNDLVFEMYNFLGNKGQHLTLERMSRFYRGQPQCGFYAEVALRSEYADAGEFAQQVASGALRDDAAPPFTLYMDEDKERLWTVEYSRDGETLGIEIDLMFWKLKRRWTGDGELGWPMLESRAARQNAEGRIEVGEAVLECGKHPAWLFAKPSERTWAAGYFGPPAPFRLELPGGSVSLDSMGTGTVVWEKGEVRIDAANVSGEPKVEGGRLR